MIVAALRAQSLGVEMRSIGLGLVLLSMLAGASAEAQVVEPWAPRGTGAWVPAGSPEDDPRAQVMPVDPVARLAAARTRRDGLITGGALALALAYAGAIVWGVHYRSSLRLGPPACNDPYADWHFVPLIGPPIGLGIGWSCIPDVIHGDEVIVSGLSGAVQIAGLGLLLGGLFREIPDAPSVALTVDEHGALARVGGRF